MSMIEVDWRPDRGKLRSFGLIALVVFGALAAWLHFKHRLIGIEMSSRTAQTAAAVLAATAAYAGLAAVLAPRVVRPLYLLLTAVTLPIGFVLSHVALASIFYAILTPVALIFRLIGRDTMHRRFDPGTTTYWVRRPIVTDARRYFRQF